MTGRPASREADRLFFGLICYTRNVGRLEHAAATIFLIYLLWV